MTRARSLLPLIVCLGAFSASCAKEKFSSGGRDQSHSVKAPEEVQAEDESNPSVKIGGRGTSTNSSVDTEGGTDLLVPKTVISQTGQVPPTPTDISSSGTPHPKMTATTSETPAPEPTVTAAPSPLPIPEVSEATCSGSVFLNANGQCASDQIAYAITWTSNNQQGIDAECCSVKAGEEVFRKVENSCRLKQRTQAFPWDLKCDVNEFVGGFQLDSGRKITGIQCCQYSIAERATLESVERRPAETMPRYGEAGLPSFVRKACGNGVMYGAANLFDGGSGRDPDVDNVYCSSFGTRRP